MTSTYFPVPRQQGLGMSYSLNNGYYKNIYLVRYLSNIFGHDQ